MLHLDIGHPTIVVGEEDDIFEAHEVRPLSNLLIERSRRSTLSLEVHRAQIATPPDCTAAVARRDRRHRDTRRRHPLAVT